ncbi:MAG: hypothetical protein D3917_12230 [Candidatus Electrothrix sp. AX5]|jgi:hypothetical protein|nr:hypothetical protein [Candidatus Electrothrix sp. AX5]
MKEKLLETASKINQPSPSALDEFSQKYEKLALQGNHLIAQRSDFEKLVGPGNQAMAEDNNRNFAKFMVSLFADFNPTVLVETVLWVFRAYRSHGFQTTYWAANINIWLDMLREELSDETFAAIAPFYNWIIVNIPVFVKLTDEAIAESVKTDESDH